MESETTRSTESSGATFLFVTIPITDVEDTDDNYGAGAVIGAGLAGIGLGALLTWAVDKFIEGSYDKE